jgi:hypothetical protein
LPEVEDADDILFANLQRAAKARKDIAGMEMPPKRVKRKFKTRWVKLDQRWAEALDRSNSVSTYKLAIKILFEAFKCKHTGSDIVLSSIVTGMSRCTKIRAANELADLGLVKIVRDGNHALRVTIIIKKEEEEE